MGVILRVLRVAVLLHSGTSLLRTLVIRKPRHPGIISKSIVGFVYPENAQIQTHTLRTKVSGLTKFQCTIFLVL